MKNLLEELWYTYEMAHPTEWSEEEKQALDVLTESEEKLFALFSDEQKEAFDAYKTSLDCLNGMFEKESYCKGIRFATAYMMEALSQTEK